MQWSLCSSNSRSKTYFDNLDSHKMKLEEFTMAIFGFGKKKAVEQEKSTCGCPCGHSVEAKAGQNVPCGGVGEKIHTVAVLGSGCSSCHALWENTKEAVKALALPVEVGYVTDLSQIAAYGVMQLPALVVNDQVVSAGRVLKSEDVEKLLQKWTRK